ncbi:MAG: hypothetical protein QM762_25170 [Chryseolinea sp.]
MKPTYSFSLLLVLALIISCQSHAQVKVKTTTLTSHELSVLNQLGSPAVTVNMPVSQLLNAPGNEALRSFFSLR